MVVYIVLFVLYCVVLRWMMVRTVLFGGSIDNDDEWKGQASLSTTACCCVHHKSGNHLGVYKMLLNDCGSSINDNHNGQQGRYRCRCRRW